jgi:hypothetical protein
MGIKVANNAFATLAAGISNSATSITVASGQGARFPVLGAGDYFYATLINTSNQLEIVKCTARSADVLTVVRAQEGTTARAYDVGDRIEIRITAATFEDATSEYDNTTSGLSATTTQGAIDELSAEKVNKAGDTMTGALNVNAVIPQIGLFPTSGGVADNQDVGGINWRLNNGSGTVVANIYFKADPNATSSGTGKLILGARANDGQTSRIDQLLIDAGGRVTMPLQPSFLATKTNGNQTGPGVISFNSVVSNVGSHYSTSTNRFTAPVAGVYWIFTSLLNIFNTRCQAAIRKNGTTVVIMEYGFSTGYQQGSLGIAVPLAVNDYVDVHLTTSSDGAYGTGSYGSFSGYLIG